MNGSMLEREILLPLCFFREEPLLPLCFLVTLPLVAAPVGVVAETRRGYIDAEEASKMIGRMRADKFIFFC